jgi:pimeloyl-ACP methyl ester carboxylesterase
VSDYLLVHGMSVSAWEWERLVPVLQSDARAGTIVTVEMPGRSGQRPGDYGAIRLEHYAGTILRALREHDLRDVILVGHSAGGICLQAVAAAEPERIRRLVFLCAAIPKRGRSMLEWQSLPQRLVSRLVLWLGRAGTRGIVPNKRFARWAMGHDLEPADCDALIARLVPEPPAMLIDRIDWPAERVRVPATYIHTTRDRIIRPKDQLRMAHTVPGVEVVSLEAGHARPVVYPERLAALLLDYAE